MPRRLIGVFATAASLLSLTSSPVSAGEGTGSTTTAAADSNPGEIAASAGMDVTGGQAAATTAVSKPRCSYFPYDMATSAIPGSTTGPARRDAATKELTLGGPAGPNTETLYTRTCPGQVPDYVWVADVVDVDALISSAYQSVSAQLPEPTLDMNPRPDVGGIVNIGLWLAVNDPGRVSITASVGPVWATVTAAYRGTTWTFGNGDSTYCDGLGTPIVDKNTADQGPCGYTYRWPSAPKFTNTDDLAYHDTAVGHWVITYATSTGRSGTLGPIDRTTEFPYQVREIQTVRVSPDAPPAAKHSSSNRP